MLAQPVVVLQDVQMFLAILDVQTHVQEIAVPQTAQLPVVQQQLAAVTYAQMHVRDANHYVKVPAKKEQHIVRGL